MDIIRDTAPGAGIGLAFGQGLGEGLSSLAEMKLKEVMQKRQSRLMMPGLRSLGYNDKDASMLSQLISANPQIGSQIVHQKLQEPNQQAFMESLNQIMGVPAQPSFAQQAMQPFEQINTGSAQAAYQTPKNIQAGFGGEPKKSTREQIEAAQAAQRANVVPQNVSAEAIRSSIGAKPQMVQPQNMQQQAPSLIGKGGLTANQAMQLANLSTQQRSLAQKQVLDQEKLELAKQKAEEMQKYHEARVGVQAKKQEHEEKKAAFKETTKSREEITTAAKAARDNNMRLERIKELDKTGKIQNPLLYSALKKMGLDIPALKNAESQELEKLSTDFLKDARAVFGARLTNFDAQTFLKTVPSLSQTKEGRARVIRNLELFNEAALLREKEMRSILKENKNIPPMYLKELVEERISPKLDELATRFKGGQSAAIEFKVGQKLASLPDPKSLPVGTEIRKKDGSVLKNTGSEWQRI